MAVVHAPEHPAVGIPDPDRLISTGRGDVCPVGGPGHTIDWLLMLLVGEEALPTAGIPDAYCSIDAGRGEQRAIGGGPGHTGDHPRMAAIGRRTGKTLA